MDEFDAALGMTEPDPQQLLARGLTEADHRWVRQLVELRKRHGLSQTDLGRLMGRTQSVVSDIESMSSDPRLSTLRRYAMAVGAQVTHQVTDAAAGAAIEVPRRVHRVTATEASRHHRVRAESSPAGWRKVNAHADGRILRVPAAAGG
ncbi:helix-turn-helix domain-containing protein [Actinophytocola sediminis]